MIYYLHYIYWSTAPQKLASRPSCESKPVCTAAGMAPAICRFDQWEFQDPEMEVPTIYKAYRVCKGISAQHMALYGTNVPPF